MSLRFVGCAVVVGLLVGAAAFWGANKEALGLFHDDGIYTVVAKSLDRGEGYRIISLPGAPAQTKYPFLYSYLLSWIWLLNPNFPQNIVAFKALNIIALIAIFFLSLQFYSRYFVPLGLGAVIFSFLVCANPIIFTFTDYVISDLLFVMLALAGLVICAPIPNQRVTMRRILSLAVITGFACLTRLAAVPFVLAGIVYSFTKKGCRGLILFLGAVALLMTPWFLWVWHNPHPPVNSLFAYYAAYDFAGVDKGVLGNLLTQHSSVIAGNASYLLQSFQLLCLTPLLPGLFFFAGALTLIGMAVSLHARELFNWSFFLCSIALLLLWPFHPGRYIAPLVPLLFLFLFRGAQTIECWIKSAKWKSSLKGLFARVAWFPLAFILLFTGVWLSGFLMLRNDQRVRGLYGNRLPYSWAGFDETFAWIRSHTPADALLATAYDPMYYLYTGRGAIRPALHRPGTYFYPFGQAHPNVGSVAEIKPQLDQLGINYLILDPLDGYAERDATLRLFDQLVKAYGDKAKKVFTSSDGKHRIYALVSE